MATSTRSDLTIYHDEFNLGVMEAEVSSVNMFNDASRNSLILSTENVQGDFLKRQFLKSISSVVAHRDPTSTGAATAKKISAAEEIGITIPRVYGPVEATRDFWIKYGQTPQAMSNILGQNLGEARLKDMVFTSALSAEAALSAVAAVVQDSSGSTITASIMNTALAKLGDAQSNVLFWLMHSKPWNDFIATGITDKVDTIYSGVLTRHQMPGLARPFGVLDVTALHDANGSLTDTYNTLGLQEGAVICREASPIEILFERVGGLDNIVYRFQAEWEINITVKGFQWGSTANPNDTALGSSGNWTQVASSIKDLAGVRIVTN